MNKQQNEAATWPIMMDMTKDQCKKALRNLELSAYSNIIAAFRAQGEFTPDKRRLLSELQSAFSISNEWHRAEVRKVINDEFLLTIAQRLAGPNTNVDWSVEGRRFIPLLNRAPPQVAYTTLATKMAQIYSGINNQMPKPCDTAMPDKFEDLGADIKIDSKACDSAQNLLDSLSSTSIEQDCNIFTHEQNQQNIETSKSDDEQNTFNKLKSPKIGGKKLRRYSNNANKRKRIRTNSNEPPCSKSPKDKAFFDNTPSISLELEQNFKPEKRIKTDSNSKTAYEINPKIVITSESDTKSVETDLKLKISLNSESNCKAGKVSPKIRISSEPAHKFTKIYSNAGKSDPDLNISKVNECENSSNKILNILVPSTTNLKESQGGSLIADKDVVPEIYANFSTNVTAEAAPAISLNLRKAFLRTKSNPENINPNMSIKTKRGAVTNKIFNLNIPAGSDINPSNMVEITTGKSVVLRKPISADKNFMSKNSPEVKKNCKNLKKNLSCNNKSSNKVPEKNFILSNKKTYNFRKKNYADNFPTNPEVLNNANYFDAATVASSSYNSNFTNLSQITQHNSIQIDKRLSTDNIISLQTCVASSINHSKNFNESIVNSLKKSNLHGGLHRNSNTNSRNYGNPIKNTNCKLKDNSANISIDEGQSHSESDLSDNEIISINNQIKRTYDSNRSCHSNRPMNKSLSRKDISRNEVKTKLNSNNNNNTLTSHSPNFLPSEEETQLLVEKAVELLKSGDARSARTLLQKAGLDLILDADSDIEAETCGNQISNDCNGASTSVKKSSFKASKSGSNLSKKRRGNSESSVSSFGER